MWSRSLHALASSSSSSATRSSVRRISVFRRSIWASGTVTIGSGCVTQHLLQQLGFERLLLGPHVHVPELVELLLEQGAQVVGVHGVHLDLPQPAVPGDERLGAR